MDESLSLSSTFFKGHGHGNDYLVIPEGTDWPVTPESVERVCHRWRGIGSDGIVAVLAPPVEPFRLRMFNPDGSEFERSGNGLRILGAYLFAEGLVQPGARFRIQVGGDELGMEILGRAPGGALQVRVDMGKARFDDAAVDLVRDALEADGSIRGPAGERLDVQAVSMGNPHCVVLRDGLSEADLLSLGPFLTSHPAFQRGTNVQLAMPTGAAQVSILIWERGVGRTSSSGTSACAVASACVKRDLLKPGRIEVVMEGGSFFVGVSSEVEVTLEGPVRPLMQGVLAPELLATLE
jgi:diaminopimelate epimerase